MPDLQLLAEHFFRNLQISPLVLLYTFSIAVFMMNNKSLCKTHSDIHNINTRNTMNLFHSPTRLKLCQKGPYHSGIKVFNSFPLEISNLSSNENSLR
jgi:hypothetical protein